MADKYTIKIEPKVSSSDAKKMEHDLNRRFASVSKKFGRNLGRSLKSAAKIGFAAAAASIAAVVLTNPFEKINNDLNKTLEKFDNTATRATQFGVSAGKYFEAEQILASAGVKDFDAVLARFSTTLAKAKPRDDGTTEDPYLREFLGAKDDLDAFYGFAKAISKLSPSERNNAAETVFGEKIGLKIAEVLQTNLAQRRNEIFAGQSRGDLTRKINTLGEIEGEQAVMRAKLAIDELNEKSKSISSATVKTQNKVEKATLANELIQLTQYEVFAELAKTQKQAVATLYKISSDITDTLVPRARKISDDFGVVKNWITSKFSKKEPGKIFK
jgi:seryl-tRNA synthetase